MKENENSFSTGTSGSYSTGTANAGTAGGSMSKLAENKKSVNTGKYMIAGGVVIFILLLIICGGVPNAFLLFLDAVLMVAGGIKIYLAKKEFALSYKEIFVEDPLKTNFENVTYKASSGFDENTVSGFGLCVMGNRFESEDYIHATYNGVDFEMSDVTVQYQSTGRSTSVHTYFSGRILTFSYPESPITSVKVYSSGFEHRALDSSQKKNEKLETDNAAFNSSFDVYSPDGSAAFYALTPQLMEKLSTLATKYQSIAVNITNNKIYVGINEPNNNAFDPRTVTDNISPEVETAKIQADIDDIKYIIDTLS